MNWFVATIVMEISIDGESSTQQYDEQLRLVQAATKEEATIKAVDIGYREEEQYHNIKGKQVRWTFKGVIHVCPVHGALVDGAELCSTIREYPQDEAPSFTFIDCPCEAGFSFQ